MINLRTGGAVLLGVLMFLEQAHSNGFLGIQLESEDATIVRVLPHSPAAEAGLATGDTVVAVNGRNVSDSRAIVEAIRGIEPGEEVSITVLRETKEQVVRAVVGDKRVFTSDNFGFYDFGFHEHSLIGTWKKVASRVSNDQEWQRVDASVTVLTQITGAYVSRLEISNDSRKVIAAIGGSVKIDGDKLIQTVEYGLGRYLDDMGRKRIYRSKVTVSMLIQSGMLDDGKYIEERFERVQPTRE